MKVTTTNLIQVFPQDEIFLTELLIKSSRIWPSLTTPGWRKVWTKGNDLNRSLLTTPQHERAQRTHSEMLILTTPFFCGSFRSYRAERKNWRWSIISSRIWQPSSFASFSSGDKKEGGTGAVKGDVMKNSHTTMQMQHWRWLTEWLVLVTNGHYWSLLVGFDNPLVLRVFSAGISKRGGRRWHDEKLANRKTKFGDDLQNDWYL